MAQCRIGFVGAGGVAARHAQTLIQFPQARLVAVTDVDLARSQRFANEYGGYTVPYLDDLLDVGLDAVYVCLPPFAHGAVEETVVGAGVALFVEKPLGLDCAVAERVARAVAAAGVVTATGHHWRYSVAVQEARQLLADRPLRLAVGSWLDLVPPVGWWSQRARSGGQIVEQAVHVLDLARLLVGEVTEVSAFADGVLLRPTRCRRRRCHRRPAAVREWRDRHASHYVPAGLEKPRRYRGVRRRAGAGELRLGEEFHHNGLAVRCAQIGRVPRGLAHCWDRDRLSGETLDLLRTDGTGIRKHLVTDVLPLAEAPALLADLDCRRRHVLQAVFTFESC